MVCSFDHQLEVYVTFQSLGNLNLGRHAGVLPWSTSRMHCIVRRAWASSAWHEGEKSSSKQWHEGEKRNNLVGVGYCFWTCVARIRTHLISGASAVSLIPRPEDRTRLLSSSLRLFSGPPSSPSLFCTGMLGGSWEPEVCCFNSAERCHIQFYVSLWGFSVVCVGYFENTIVPYRRPLKLHFENFNINYPLDLLCMLWEHGCEKYTECIFKFFSMWLS